MGKEWITNVWALFIVVFGYVCVECTSAIAQGTAGVDFHDRREMSSPVLRQRVTALIDAINLGDRASVERFLKDHATEAYQTALPLDARVSQFRMAQWRMGKIQLEGERLWTDQPTRTYFPIVRDITTGTWWYLEVAVDGDDAFLVTRFSQQPITAPQFAKEGAFRTEDLGREVAAMISAACKRGAFSGAVIVAHLETTLATAVCGEADKSFGAPNTLDTKFNLASMNKMFTAVAVMRLVEQGRISLSDTLDRYLSDKWLSQDVARQITIAELLSHRSGLTEFPAESGYLDLDKSFMTVDSLASLTQASKPAFTPGSQFRYSNLGFVVLGAVIEAVTAEDYYDVVRRQIYTPAGMSNSDTYPFDEVVKNVAVPYEFTAEPGGRPFRRSPFLVRHARGTPAGGGYSTARDLYRFAAALLRGKLLRLETLNSMWKDYSGYATGFYGYGYGFEVYESGKERTVGHGGSAPGVSAVLHIRPESGYSIVVLSNYGGAAVPIAKRLVDLIAQTANRSRLSSQSSPHAALVQEPAADVE